MAQTPLQKILAVLRKRYGAPKPHAAGRNPLVLVLWEMVAYLATDDIRAKAFQALKDEVGLAPAALLKAPLPGLTAICRIAGSVQQIGRAHV